MRHILFRKQVVREEYMMEKKELIERWKGRLSEKIDRINTVMNEISPKHRKHRLLMSGPARQRYVDIFRGPSSERRGFVM